MAVRMVKNQYFFSLILSEEYHPAAVIGLISQFLNWRSNLTDSEIAIQELADCQTFEDEAQKEKTGWKMNLKI